MFALKHINKKGYYSGLSTRTVSGFGPTTWPYDFGHPVSGRIQVFDEKEDAENALEILKESSDVSVEFEVVELP